MARRETYRQAFKRMFPKKVAEAAIKGAEDTRLDSVDIPVVEKTDSAILMFNIGWNETDQGSEFWDKWHDFLSSQRSKPWSPQIARHYAGRL